MNCKATLCVVLTCILLLTTSFVYGTEVKWAGFRSSIYGASQTAGENRPEIPFPAPQDWAKGCQTIVANFSAETEPTVAWIVGTVDTDDLEQGKLKLEMKRPGPEYKDIHFVDDSDIDWSGGYTEHEKWLSYFDKHGIKVLLQVEPGHSEIAPVIQLVMETWGQHESVIGFGVDIEWYRNNDGAKGGEARVSASTLVKWLDVLHQVKPEAKLMVKHWDPNNLADASLKEIPIEKRPYLIFCCDSQGIGSFERFVKEMAAFAQAYEDGEHSSDVWYQIGYATDWWETPPWAPENEPWFYRLKEGWQPGRDGIPAEERALLPGIIGNALAEAISPNQKIGILWVDFTMHLLYPDIFPEPAQ